MTTNADDDKLRKGPLKPAGEDGLVVIENPPDAPLHMSPDEADISGIRLMDAAHRARQTPGEREAEDRQD